MSDTIVVHVTPEVSPFAIHGESVDRIEDSPFVIIRDPVPHDSTGTTGIHIDGREFLLIHIDHIVSIEGNQNQLSTLLEDEHS